MTRRLLLDEFLEKIIDRVAHDRDNYDRIAAAHGETEQRAVIAAIAEKALEGFEPPEGIFITRTIRSDLSENLFNELIGFGPIQPLIFDKTVTEIMVNGPDRVFIERNGLIQPAEVRFRSVPHLANVIERIVSRLGRRIDESSPMVDARLPDGSRVNAAIPPVALNGPFLTIRKFPGEALSVASLVERGALTVPMADFLRAAVAAKFNIIISGGTGSGKTTLLNALASLTPPNERIVTIEDSAELHISNSHANICSFEARPTNIEGRGAITIRDLIRNALRMRPDRLIVGEVRGPEALDMLQAMNTGHEGSFTTAHANSAGDLFSRLETMVCMASTELSISAIRETIASAVQLVIQVSRLEDGSRKITQIVEAAGSAGDGRIVQNPIWSFESSMHRFHGFPVRTRTRIEQFNHRSVPLYLPDEADEEIPKDVCLPGSQPCGRTSTSASFTAPREIFG